MEGEIPFNLIRHVMLQEHFVVFKLHCIVVWKEYKLAVLTFPRRYHHCYDEWIVTSNVWRYESQVFAHFKTGRQCGQGNDPVCFDVVYE